MPRFEMTSKIRKARDEVNNRPDMGMRKGQRPALERCRAEAERMNWLRMQNAQRDAHQNLIRDQNEQIADELYSSRHISDEHIKGLKMTGWDNDRQGEILTIFRDTVSAYKRESGEDIDEKHAVRVAGNILGGIKRRLDNINFLDFS